MVTTGCSYIANDEAATVALGEVVGAALQASSQGVVIDLKGDLGAGKTTFTRGVLRAFGHQGAVKSPTYTLVEEYQLQGRRFYHFDLYRLYDPEELEYMGIRDYFGDENLCLVEWSVRGEGVLPSPDVQIELAPWGDGRCIRIHALSPRGLALVGQLTAQNISLIDGITVCDCAAQ